MALEKQLADKASSEALNNVIWRERESKIRFEETSRQNFPLKGSLSGKFSILSPIAKNRMVQLGKHSHFISSV